MAEFPVNVFDAFGLIGVALYLGAYAALQFGWIHGSSSTYTLLNFGGASLVLISLLSEFNMASALIQISWIVISLVGLTRRYLINRRLRFSAEEDAFLTRRLSDLPKPSARAFLDAGNWVDVPENYRLLTEGEPVGNLFYISDGRAQVSSAEQHLADLAEGFLGEINVLRGTPASATVTTAEPSRLFVISHDALQRLLRTGADLRIGLEGSLTKDTARKLMAANQRLVDVEKGNLA